METGTKKNPVVRNVNKPLYALYILAGIYFLFKKDVSQAVIFWGIALVFDPFDTQVPFNKRPVYQQLWLIVHLAITFGLLGIELLGK